MSHSSKLIDRCQICNSKDLEPVLFLGFVPPVNSMPVIGDRPCEKSAYPLELVRCSQCTLVQISCEVDPSILFPPEYPFRTGVTRIARENFANLCIEVFNIKPLGEKDLVIDIGSNDGTLLSNFVQKSVPVLGVEPSMAAQEANRNGVRSLMDFFSAKTADKVKKEYGKASVITCTNVFAHIRDVHDVMQGVKTLLREDGIFISENHYLGALLETVQYDTIYHEHLRYYAVNSLQHLFDMHGMEIFHVESIQAHGGSIRVYSCFKGAYAIKQSVGDFLSKEEAQGVTSGSALKKFKQDVQTSKTELLSILADIKRKGQKVYGIGAPSRASTLVTYTGLDDYMVDAIMEVSASPKVGKYMPGTLIPVLDESTLFDKQPEYALLLSWHIGDELMTILKKKGYKGRFIFPLPVPRMV